MAAKNLPNEKTAAYSLFIALIKRDKNTMKYFQQLFTG
jgi:hypothetical protein